MRFLSMFASCVHLTFCYDSHSLKASSEWDFSSQLGLMVAVSGQIRAKLSKRLVALSDVKGRFCILFKGGVLELSPGFCATGFDCGHLEQLLHRRHVVLMFWMPWWCLKATGFRTKLAALEHGEDLTHD